MTNKKTRRPPRTIGGQEKGQQTIRLTRYSAALIRLLTGKGVIALAGLAKGDVVEFAIREFCK